MLAAEPPRPALTHSSTELRRGPPRAARHCSACSRRTVSILITLYYPFLWHRFHSPLFPPVFSSSFSLLSTSFSSRLLFLSARLLLFPFSSSSHGIARQPPCANSQKRSSPPASGPCGMDPSRDLTGLTHFSALQ